MINLIYTFDAKSWNLTQYPVVAGKQSSAPLKKNDNPLFTMISKNIYKNYKILIKIEKYIKMSNKNLRKTNRYTLCLGLLLELKKGEDVFVFLASIMLPPIIEHLKCLKLLYKVLATQSSIQQNH